MRNNDRQPAINDGSVGSQAWLHRTLGGEDWLLVRTRALLKAAHAQMEIWQELQGANSGVLRLERMKRAQYRDRQFQALYDILNDQPKQEGNGV